MASSLDDILKELDASYNPQRQAIQSRIDALPAQADAEIAGLKGTQDQAFGDILNGARDRGLGFSGIPLADQAKYTSSTFLPAVAKVRQSQNDTKSSLFDALNNVNLDQNKYAQSIRDSQLSRDEQARQFDASLAAQKQATQAFNYGSLYGDNSAQQNPQQTPKPTTDPQTQKAYNDVQNLISKDPARIQREYLAIKQSAAYGNAYDKIKQGLIEQLYPTAKNFGSNNVGLSQAQPTLVSLNPAPYSGLSVGVANPGTIKVR